jgi:AbrB family looped-hinge helix DNA binding protein
MITTVTGKNQITIPAQLAREFDITPGTRLDWTKGSDGTLIVKIQSRGTGHAPGGTGETSLATGQ